MAILVLQNMQTNQNLYLFILRHVYIYIYIMQTFLSRTDIVFFFSFFLLHPCLFLRGGVKHIYFIYVQNAYLLTSRRRLFKIVKI